MAFTKRKLVPDENILSGIFPGKTDLQLASCHIISNTFDTCTFRIKDYLVRLATSSLAGTAILQNMAYKQLPGLVPPVLDIGSTMSADADAREVGYFVTTYCLGASSLEAIWDTLDQEQQVELIDAVAHAIQKIQLLDLRNIGLQSLPVSGADHWLQPGRIGGPKHGYFSTIGQFLEKLYQSTNGACSLSDTEDGGLAIESVYEDIGRLELTRLDLESLQKQLVFCHNDLERRNILVRKIPGADGREQYELAAIVDWEMAGFYPFAYEYSLQDSLLGSSNLSFSWYSLFKERMFRLLPHDNCQTKFIRALGIIDESRKRGMTRNVSALFQIRWRDREQIQRSSDLRRGWVRKAMSQTPPPFTENDQTTLENEILEELGHSIVDY
ncbi:hypothetical protein PG995_004660 [Apiospora arundinis]